MQRLTDHRRGAGLATLIVLMSMPALAQADQVAETELLRQWPAPAGLSLDAATVDAGLEGTLLLRAAAQGSDQLPPVGCINAIADTRRALSYNYRHNFAATRCFDALAHPDGGLIVRGEVVSGDTDSDPGFTTRIAADGDVLWTVEDEDLVDRQAPPDGPGQFYGEYAGARAGLAYDAESDRVAGLSLGEITLVTGTRSRTQAHLIDAQTGEVQVVGRTFGPTDDDHIVDIAARDGEFLVHTVDDDDEPHFYSWEIDNRVQSFEPEAVDWSPRELVTPLVYGSQSGTFYLWTERDAPQSGSGMLRVEGLDSVVWSEEYEQFSTVDGITVLLGIPRQYWVGQRLVALLYQSSDGREFIRFVDRDDGSELAVLDWERLIDSRPIGMYRNIDGSLVVVGALAGSGETQIQEFSLRLVDDSGNAEGPDDEAGGCSTVPHRPSSPLLAFVALLWWSRRHR